MTWQWQLGVGLVCVAMAFLTSAWVNAVTRLSKRRAERLAQDSPKRGPLLVKIAEDPSPFVTSTLLVMLLARVGAIVLALDLLRRTGVPYVEIIAVLGMTFVLFHLAEVAPRTWVLERLDQVLLLSALPVYLLGRVLAPVSMALLRISRLFLLILPGRGLPRGPLTSEEEIKSIVDVAEKEEVIEAGEREMIHSIFEFTDTVVREVMVPRPDMICVESSASLEEVLEIAIRKGVSRIPVISDNIDDIVGIVYEKDLIRRLHNGGGRSKVRKAGDIARDATFAPETKKVAELLREMQRTKTHMVIVVDEYGGTAGLATLEDILEEIVGEISDEYDRDEPAAVRVDPTTVRVSARFSISELNELLDAELPHEDWDSVGGLVAGLLGRVPSAGDGVVLHGIRFEVERVRGRRIEKLLVHHPSDATDH